MAVYFVTDFHLGIPSLKDSQERERKLLRFLDGIRPDCEELYLMGDLFDFWFEYKTVIPKGFVRLQGKLAEFTDAGIPVHMFIGNHDLWSFGYMHDELGLELHREPVVKAIKGKKFFLVHGDGRGPGDKGYKLLKKVFECKFNQFLFRLIHPDFGIGLALRWSHNHRLKKLKNEVERGYYDDIPNTRLYQYAQEQAALDPSIDFFVFGHQHKPMQYKTGDHALTTVVGNWIYDFTYAVFDGERVELKYFEKQDNNYNHTIMQITKNYIEANKERFLEELFGLIRIPSISSESAHKPDMIRCAEYWRDAILAAGADKTEVMPTEGNPIVYGEKIIDPKLPIVLVYGHYDVMPVDPIDLWHTDPFEPVIKDGKIWARGADDDKGQSFMHAKAFETMVKTNTLPCNVKFMLEGEEEIGSGSLSKWIEKYKDLVKADVILVSDTSMIGTDVPSITTGLRGLAYWEIEVTGPNADLHSGLFGGSVANPLNTLCEMIAKCMDESNHITIPHFYDDVIECSARERELLNMAPYNEENYKNSVGVKALRGEEGYTKIERVGVRPTFDLCGMWGGYTGEGSKTVLPSKAYAKLSCRLVPNQDHEKIAVLVKDYFEKNAPEYVTVKVTPLHGGQAYGCPIDLPAYKAAEAAYMDTYGKLPIPMRSGGSIPIIARFEEVLGIKSILMGFGLGEDAIHSPNENYRLDHFYKGIETIIAFYQHFAKGGEIA